MLEYYFECPHCWESQLKMVDPSINNQSFIEDCEICCNPLEFDLSITDNSIQTFSVIPVDQ